MKNSRLIVFAVVLALGSGIETAHADAVGTAFTFQGQLKDGGSPANGDYDFVFRLFDDPNTGAQIGSDFPVNDWPVSDGLFSVPLDFGENIFTGEARWLEIVVNGTTLSPRQELTPAPYALALPGLRTEQNANCPNLIGGYSGNSVTAGVVGATIAGGGESASTNGVTDDYGAIGGGLNNQAGDAAGTTSDRLYATVGGGSTNTASGYAATVGGGDSNTASFSYDTVGGGHSNTGSGGFTTVAGGSNNQASSFAATVSGGSTSTATGQRATVGGGGFNTASFSYATVAGGSSNQAGGFAATVGGGDSNTAAVSYATVPGGYNNQAGGVASFAAGHRAKANHDGTFVWSDYNDADFTSTGPNQFLIRAAGGVGIGTPSPVCELEVANLTPGDGAESAVTANDAGGAIAAYSSTLPDPLAHYAGRVSLLSDAVTMGLDLRADGSDGDIRFHTGGSAASNERMRITDTGSVGIGTTSPDSLLEVESTSGGHGIRSTTTSGIPVAAYRTSTASTWPAIHAECNSEVNDASAIRAYIMSTSPGLFSAAVKGVNQGTGDYGMGVIGRQEGSGSGVYGYTPDGRGVYGHSTSGTGVWGSGGGCGAYFEHTDGEGGYAYVGSQGYGILGYGPHSGAYFQNTSDSCHAYVADMGWGIVASGTVTGGSFADTDSAGSARVGYSTYKIWGDGAVAFVQNHPDDADKVIVYACPEGDEVATYTRGTARLVNGVAVVPLGETFKWVTNPDIGLTAHLTPRGDCHGLYVASLSTSELLVRELAGGANDVVFDYIVYGLRIGFEEVSIVQEKDHEAYIPSMADHRELYERRPELRKYNALERFGAMRAALGEAGPLDLNASHALRDAIVEFDPAVHELPGGGRPPPDDPVPAGERDDSGSAVDPDTGGEPIRPITLEGTPRSALQPVHETLGQKDAEIEALRARLDALEALVAELTNTAGGGAQ